MAQLKGFRIKGGKVVKAPKYQSVSQRIAAGKRKKIATPGKALTHGTIANAHAGTAKTLRKLSKTPKKPDKK